MKEEIKARLAALRTWMKSKGLSAFIIPSSDPHQSEYVAPHWQCREWISGFTGSAGTVVVTEKSAGLWTDSRYFLQAEEQLRGTGIKLFKLMLPETPSIVDYLCQKHHNSTIGIDGQLFSLQEVKSWDEKLGLHGIEINSLYDPFEEIWTDRPELPLDAPFVHDIRYAGQSATDKLQTIRTLLKQKGCEAILVSALDEIAWTLNLRGNDVHCNPVTISHLVITLRCATLFIDPRKVTPEVAAYLKEIGVKCLPYTQMMKYIRKSKIQNWWFDEKGLSYIVYNYCFSHFSANETVHLAHILPSPIPLLKAIRNDVQISCLHEAMKRDGVALVKFLRWLEAAVPAGGQTEMSIDRKLHELRAEQPLYVGESFDTIAGYKDHAAIVHYEATPETDRELKPEGYLLLDSGAQYLDATTDITRTIALGPLTDEEREDYTLILKGHIDLAMAIFPEGTRGAQLDILARTPIWQKRMNFLHGTGHGVGQCLNVHEGPQSIRMNENPVPLQVGMLTSNEPGVYKAGSHGIRTENLVLTVPAGEGMFGRYLKFETITLCPICKKGIRRELLTKEEIDWLNAYHQKVYDTLAPELNDEEKAWLRGACEAIEVKDTNA